MIVRKRLTARQKRRRKLGYGYSVEINRWARYASYHWKDRVLNEASPLVSIWVGVFGCHPVVAHKDWCHVRLATHLVSENAEAFSIDMNEHLEEAVVLYEEEVHRLSLYDASVVPSVLDFSCRVVHLLCELNDACGRTAKHMHLWLERPTLEEREILGMGLVHTEPYFSHINDCQADPSS